MSKIYLKSKLKLSCKNDGSTFLIAVFLSVIILSLGLGAAQMVLKELNFSSDLLYGEQAYYAAESGVESALIDLEKNPVQHVIDIEVPLGRASFLPSIYNQTLPGESFGFALAPLQSSRFRLLRDEDDTDVYDDVKAQSFGVTVFLDEEDDVLAVDKSWQWKTLCQDGSGKTHALQNTTDSSQYDNFLNSSAARGFVPGGEEMQFQDWVKDMVPASCFFSVQNLSDEDLKFEFTPVGEILAPAVARVEATGKSGNRQKRINFDYAQQNLSGLFDFVFFHTEGN